MPDSSGHLKPEEKRERWQAAINADVELDRVLDEQLKLQRAMVEGLKARIYKGFGYKALENGELDPKWVQQVNQASGALARLAAEYRQAQKAAIKAGAKMSMDEKVEQTVRFIHGLAEGMQLRFLADLLDDPVVAERARMVLNA